MSVIFMTPLCRTYDADFNPDCSDQTTTFARDRRRLGRDLEKRAHARLGTVEGYRPFRSSLNINKLPQMTCCLWLPTPVMIDISHHPFEIDHDLPPAH
jgi:hypothetical protein